MSLRHLGTLSLGQCMPMALVASAQLSASVSAVLPSIKAKVESILQMQASLALEPPSLLALLQMLLQMVDQVRAAIALGLPGVDFQVAATASLLAEAQAELGQLSATLDFGAELGVLLGTSGIDLYAYEGPVNAMGHDVDVQLAGGLPSGGGSGDRCVAVLLATANEAAELALARFFRSP